LKFIAVEIIVRMPPMFRWRSKQETR